MTILKLSAILLVGAFSIVAAEPGPKESTERTSYTKTPGVTHPVGEWFTLTTPTPASHGSEYITVDPDNARLSQLRLATSTGRLEVRTVRVDYTDGTRQLIRVDRQITKGRPALVDLKGAKIIKQLVVTTERWGKGSYTIEAVAAGVPSVGT